MSRNIFFIVFSLFFILFFSSSVFSAVEVFSNYDTVLKVTSDNNILINKSLTLKNVYDVGIVPGQIEFKIGKGVDGSVGNIDIENIKAFDSFGNEIKAKLRNTKEYSIIVLDVYYPLLPGFEYEFNLIYSMSYEPGGIFFKSLQIPLRESTIPIQNGKFKVILPNNYHFTYLSTSGMNSTINKGSATWNIKDDLPKSVVFEYSYLPVKFGDLKGSYVFWITVNIILLLILVFEVRREINRVKNDIRE